MSNENVYCDYSEKCNCCGRNMEEFERLKAQIEKIKTMLEEKDEAYNCMGHTNSNEMKRFIKHLLTVFKKD